MHPIAKAICSDMEDYCNTLKLPFCITETVTTKEEDKALKRVSQSHNEGRAFDLSVHGWTRKHEDNFQRFFTQKYLAYAAQDSSGKPRLIVLHDSGNGYHCHVQIHRKYAVLNIALNPDLLIRSL